MKLLAGRPGKYGLSTDNGIYTVQYIIFRCLWSELGKYSRALSCFIYCVLKRQATHTYTTSRLTTIIIEDWILFGHTSMGINAENVRVY